ncbi:MAG: hypothetical protein IVW54_11245 [Candidatus Binataceae bacterium]|nr:hypothetical protein [Candidatus Binataceae bacterium]
MIVGATGGGQPCATLTDQLPLTIRTMLANSPRAEEQSIALPGRGLAVNSMREVARAIRHFAATRAREHWAECSLPLASLEAALAQAHSAGKAPFICLRCAVFVPPCDPQLHREPGCIVAELSGSSPRYTAPERVRRIIEKFRAYCVANALPHHDLDCYMADDQMVFTWRPPVEEPGAPMIH